MLWAEPFFIMTFMCAETKKCCSFQLNRFVQMKTSYVTCQMSKVNLLYCPEGKTQSEVQQVPIISALQRCIIHNTGNWGAVGQCSRPQLI